MAEKQSNLKNKQDKLLLDEKAAVESSILFLYNGQFSILAAVCSLPLLYFGGERLFGIGAICLLIVYIIHVSFNDTRSSVICFIICVAIMQFFILYSIGPLLWQSLLYIFFLLVYNVFIVLTGGLGLIQFRVFRRDEAEFCANIEYFLFLLFPPCCVFLLMWLISWTFGVYLAPCLIIILGFPMCHTFLDPNLKPSFTTKTDHVLGQPEKMLLLFNFIFSPCFVYFLINFFNLLHYSAWISMLFFICVPLFLVTFLDTTDLRDITDIRNSQWQFFQVFTGCLSLILGAILVYIHGIVDGVNVSFLAIILLCSTVLFVGVKYRFKKIVSSVACGLLLTSYLAWFTTLPWNLISTMGDKISVSFFTVELVLSILGTLSVVAIAVSISARYRSYLNQILVLHTFGFVCLEVVMVDSKVYCPYLMIFTSVFVLYLVQRLYQVHRLNKAPAVICISLHFSKLLSMFTLFNWSSALGVSSSTLGAWPAFLLACGGFLFSATLTSILLFEERKQLDQNTIFRHMGFLFVSLVLLSSTFVQTFCAFLIHNNPSAAENFGFILTMNGACFAKLAFRHSNDQSARKQSILVLCIGVLFTVFQPYFNIFEIFWQIPRLIFREIFYDTWHVIYAEYVVLPWFMLVSLLIILMLLLKLLSVRELTSLSLDIISLLIGAPIGLYIAHCVLPYPKLPSSVLSIPYMICASITTRSLLRSFKAVDLNTSVKVYIVFLLVSVISMAGEISHEIRINILQSKIPPSVLYQAFLHLLTIIQLQPQNDLQKSLDHKESSFPSLSRNISLLLIFLSGLLFSPKHYYDILLVPVCGLLLMLKINGFGVVKIKNRKHVLQRVLFVGVLGSILFYRVMQQLPWGKWSFWNVVAFTLEISVIITSFLVYLVILSVFWHQSIGPNEKLGLAALAPVFTLMLFYGRTAAGQVLGFVGPVLAYNAFYYQPR